MRTKLILLLSVSLGLSACSARDNYLFLASQSMTVSQQQHYIMKARQLDELQPEANARLENNCGANFYSKAYGGFTTGCS
ncbi:MAG: hypothetical protein R3A13_10525 [Bdellovibrionota bacterium]